MSLRKKHLKNSQVGSATVEFAIISALMVVMVAWSHLFFDLIQLRMKALEAARTAVFEFTAYGMSDYDTGNHSSRFNDIKESVMKDLNDKLYQAKDLDSSTYYKTGKQPTNRLSIKNTGFSYTITTGNDLDPSSVIGAALDAVSSLFGGSVLVPFLKFNTRGFAQSEVTLNILGVDNHFGKQIKQGTIGTFEKSNVMVGKMKTEKFTMLVDSWKLEDGCNVGPNGKYLSEGDNTLCTKNNGQDSQFYKQLGRLKPFGDLGFNVPGVFKDATSLNPLVTRVASINFKGDPALSARGSDGMSQLDGTAGVHAFFTAPFCDTGTVGAMDS
ncbi:MAG: TadE family protein, partial [Myxococcota bacterium]